MAKVTTRQLFTHSQFGNEHLEYEIHVNSKGAFFAKLDVEYESFVKASKYNYDIKGNRLNLFCNLMDELEEAVELLFKAKNEPIVTTEEVILYNIQSQVAFAVDKKGQICPNAERPNSRWAGYGNIHSSNPADGGYSLTIGARVYNKNLLRLPNGETITEYTWFDRTEAGRALNSWRSFSLDTDTAEEMPYSDNAAIFFYDLLLGMATVSKKIQEMTSSREDILKLINNNTKLLSH